MPRAYAVGAAFSVHDVEDQWAWRPTDIHWTDVTYRRARPRTAQPTSDNRRPRQRQRTASPVQTRVDPSRIRTPQQQKVAGRRVCAAG